MLRIIIVGISFKGRLSSSKIDDSKAFAGTYDIDRCISLTASNQKFATVFGCLKT